MAEKKSKSRKLTVSDVGVTIVERDTLQKVTAHLRENPVLYAAVAGFVVLCLAAGFLYRLGAQVEDRKVMTQFAKALESEDPKEQMEKLSAVAGLKSRWTAESLYMQGEAAIRAEEYGKAEEAFKRIVSEFPSSEYAARATAGLAFLAENKGDLDAALAGYQDVLKKWPESFVGRCQPLNIGRVQEGKGDLKAAIESYQSQIDRFKGSNVAKKAQAALDRLQESHPDLFPAKEAAKAEEGEKAVKEGEAAAPAAPAAAGSDAPKQP